jgi:CRISPR-associated exonuclease Cas4
VLFDDSLRKVTEDAAEELHALFESGLTPKPVYEKKCDSCSFINLCLPKTLEGSRSANHYLLKAIQEP